MPAVTGELLSNRTYDQIRLGDSASLARTAGSDDLSAHGMSTYVDPRLSDTNFLGHATSDGMWTTALVSLVLGTKLPGPGTVHLGQEVKFLRRATPGELVTATVRVIAKRDQDNVVVFEAVCTGPMGEELLRGLATVIAPDRSVALPQPGLPAVRIARRHRYEAFIAEARRHPRAKAAIVHPCSPAAILGAIEVRDEGLLDPVLVGPEARIRAAAETAGVSLEGIAIEPVEHSHAAAARAVELAVAGKVSLLVKGSQHTDELLSAVVAHDSGLRTDRRISHVYVLDVPAYDKLLIVTDAAVNILPTLEHKRDICQNAIDLLRALGMEQPRVAVLAAVETVNAAMPATLDAAALSVMASRGQIAGGLVDGPLAFDNAINPEAARTKGIVSPVAGQADILVVPDLEAGNMLAKQLIYFGGATAAGLVLGARVPIVLTSRSDPLSARIASAALAKLLVVRRMAEKVPSP